MVQGEILLGPACIITRSIGNPEQWERDFKQMHELGFEFTHFAEFVWAQLEPEEGKYDFAWLDKAVALAAKYDLKGYYVYLNRYPPVWLSQVPEILLKQENGTILDHGARQHASLRLPYTES